MPLDDRSDSYLRTIIDTVPDVLFVQDTSGIIRMANRATATVLGLPAEAIVGRLHREISTRHKDVAELEDQIRTALESGEGQTVERSVEDPVTSETRWFETRVVPLFPPDAGPPQALVVGTDFTARRNAEDALRIAQQETLSRLARAAEFRDDDTGQHTRRVGRLSAQIARLLGFDEIEVKLIRQAAPLHDLGKIGIPDSILLKPGKLTEAEYKVMKRHTEIGAMILSGGESAVMAVAEEVAIGHHERWDGTGYPRGLHEDEVSPAARMVAVADVVDALSHDRPYRKAWSMPKVVEEIRKYRGVSYQSDCVDACLEILDSPGDSNGWEDPVPQLVH